MLGRIILIACQHEGGRSASLKPSRTCLGVLPRPSRLLILRTRGCFRAKHSEPTPSDLTSATMKARNFFGACVAFKRMSEEVHTHQWRASPLRLWVLQAHYDSNSVHRFSKRRRLQKTMPNTCALARTPCLWQEIVRFVDRTAAQLVGGFLRLSSIQGVPSRPHPSQLVCVDFVHPQRLPN